jgi:hydrogenase nickel incorporation protein HypA/HybF
VHELSLCRNLISIIADHSTKLTSKHVITIYLEIGVLAAVEKSALQFNFNILKKNTVAEHALLSFIDVPGEALCDFCQKHVKLIQYHDPCPNCGRFSLTIIKGLELRIKSMEVA